MRKREREQENTWTLFCFDFGCVLESNWVFLLCA